MKTGILRSLLVVTLGAIMANAQTKINFTGTIHRGTGLQTNGIVQIINRNNRITTIGKINSDGTFLVDSTAIGQFYFYAIPDPKAGSDYLPTYYLEYLTMNEATIIPSGGNVSGININLIQRTSSENGLALLEGRFSYADFNSDDNTELSRNWLDNAYTPSSPIAISQPPCKNMSVLLYNSSNQVVAFSVTDLQGYYSFKNLKGGNYRIEGQRYPYTTEYGGYLFVAAIGTTQTNLRMVNQAVTGLEQLEEDKNSSLQVFPNPFVSVLNLGQYKGDLIVSDLLGSVYYVNTSFEGGEIYTESWPKGIYLLKMGNKTNKVVKN